MADIASLYQTYLGRAPDQAGLDYWNNVLKSGGSLADITSNFQKSAATEMQNTQAHQAAVAQHPLAQTTALPAAMTPGQSKANDAYNTINSKPLSAYDTYGGYQTYQDGSNSAMFMDQDVKDFYSNYEVGQGVPAAIKAKADAMNQLYNTQGWNGVLQHAKDQEVQQAQNAVNAFQTNPNKKWDDGTTHFSDILEGIGVATLPFTMGAGLQAAGVGAAASGSGAAAAGGAAASGSGLAGAGTAAAASGIPTVSVVGNVAAGGLSTAGTVAAGAGTAAGLGSVMNNSNPTNVNSTTDPNIPKVVINGNTGATGSTSLGNMLNPAAGVAGGLLTAGQVTAPSTDHTGFDQPAPISGVTMPESSLPVPVFGGTPSGTPINSTTAPLPADTVTPITTPGGIGSVTNPNPSSGTTLPSLPGLGSIIGGIGTVLSGITDNKMNQADKDYYQNLMNKMMGMYMPGTPEADLMEKKMNAQDAAAGRNSQYGIRAQNLAGMLADQRTKVMTSPTFEKLAEASRGHYDASLNSLSGLLGSANTSGTALNSLVNAGGSYLSDLFKSYTAPDR